MSEPFAATHPAVAAAGLLLLAIGIVVAGAPFARAGKPSPLRIGALFLAGVVGLVLMRDVGKVVAIAVIGVSCGIVVLSLHRWPPAEWLERDRRIRTTRVPAGLLVSAPGTLFGFLGLIGVVSDTTGGIRVLLAALVALATLWVWARLATEYVGPVQPQRH